MSATLCIGQVREGRGFEESIVQNIALVSLHSVDQTRATLLFLIFSFKVYLSDARDDGSQMVISLRMLCFFSFQVFHTSSPRRHHN